MAGRVRGLVALAVTALVVGLAPSGAAVAAGSAAAKPRKVCRWTKATKKSKRRRVCVTRTVKAKPKPAVPAVPASVSAPALPEAAAPAAGAATTTVGDAPAPAAPTPTPAVPAPARLQVTAREFSLVLSRPAVAAGTLIAQLVNRGEDPHDLHLRDAEGADRFAVAETPSGGVVTAAAVTLSSGTYTLYCALPGHEAAGMRASLTVA